MAAVWGIKQLREGWDLQSDAEILPLYSIIMGYILSRWKSKTMELYWFGLAEDLGSYLCCQNLPFAPSVTCLLPCTWYASNTAADPSIGVFFPGLKLKLKKKYSFQTTAEKLAAFSDWKLGDRSVFLANIFIILNSQWSKRRIMSTAAIPG